MIRSLAALALSATLAGCGFTPLYSVEGDTSVAAAMRDVYLVELNGPAAPSQHLAEALRNALPGDAQANGRYQLAIDLRDQRRSVVVTVSAATRRYDYTLLATYNLIDGETGAKRRQSLSTTVSYGVVESQYASLVGREDAERRAAIELARKIEFDIALYLKDRAPVTGSVQLPDVMGEELVGEDLRNEGEVVDDVETIPPTTP
ncbi:LPS assembly lipoprotein LptE [Parvularcula sp. LCG005]|uniref:LPS assembly lipoprotein LptE n=1 Tax=Parvularcula sp. LCG005 TaxID=3078805 RepID=UPI0029427C1B|nr:LPS assembly lipoprotein LptE [Parvularcula sp. LCG005]WOI53226.1 LPS assembly lipoprotein LptE [Parvularcula sp. LCG005]